MFEAGACGIDLEVDAFAPFPGPAAWTTEALAYTLSQVAPPRKFTTDRGAVRRQRALIDAVHAHGSEDLMDTLCAAVAMRKAVATPCIMISYGEDSKIVRLVCPMLGSMLVIAVQPIQSSYFPLQPPMRSIRAVFDNMDWAVTKPPEE